MLVWLKGFDARICGGRLIWMGRSVAWFKLIPSRRKRCWQFRSDCAYLRGGRPAVRE